MKKKKLRKYFMVIMSLILLLTSTNMSGVMAAENEEEYKNYNLHITVERNYDYAREVCRIVNEERRKEGIEPVVLDEQLTEWAMIRAKEIGYMYAHSRPNKTGVNSLFKKYHIVAMENIAMCETLPEHAMQDWMNSPGHRRNIMDSGWISVGIGCVKYNSTYCWVQLFSEKEPVQETGHNNITSVEDIELSSFYLKMTAKDFPSQLEVGKSAVFTLSQVNIDCDLILFVPNADSFDYESSDQSIASIDAEGNVQAISPGTVTLTAYYAGTSDVAYSTTLTCIETEDVSTPSLEPTISPDMGEEYTENECEKINIHLCDIIMTSCPQYAGKEVKPKFKVVCNENGYTETLKVGKDYTVKYINNRKPGTGTVIITGIGRFYNVIAKDFEITPRKNTVTFKKKNGEKNIVKKVSWGKTVKKFVPKKKGYKFIGWYNASTGKKFAFTSKIKNNVVLYAKWKRL